MGLMYAKYPHPEPIERAVKLVMSRQLPVRCPRPRASHVASKLTLPFCVGWFMGAGGDRGDVQSDGCDLVPELQVLIYDLDVGQG